MKAAGRAASTFERLALYPTAFASLGAALLYLFLNYPNFINSDSGSVILLAEDILRNEQWTPTSWRYVSDQVPLFASAQLAIPFVAILGPSVLAHAMTAACGAALLLTSTYYLGRVTGLSGEWSLLSGAGVLSATSLIYADLLLGQMVSVELAKLCLFLAFMIQVCRATRTPTHFMLLACLILGLQFAASPRKASAFFLLPTLGAMVLGWLPLLKRPALTATTYQTLALLLASLAGSFAHQQLSSWLHINTEYASLVPARSAEIVQQNLETLLALARRFLGFSGDGPVLPAGLQLAADLSRMLVLSFLGFSVGWGAWHAARGRNATLGFLCAFSIGATLLILATLLLGSGIKPYYGIYYFVYAGVPLLILATHALVHLSTSIRNTIILLGVAPTLAFSGFTFLHANPAHGVSYTGPGINQMTDNAEKQILIKWLKQRDIKAGYAPFWDANAITVLSDGHIRVAPLKSNKEPFLWLTSTETIMQVQSAAAIFVAVPWPYGTRLTTRCTPSAVHHVGPYRVYILRQDADSCISPLAAPK